MRFPVVLFDLDGTLIDSGAMILDSFRHAARTVLDVELSDEALLAGVGAGSGLRDQMASFDRYRVEELIVSYRAHNELAHERLECCLGIEGLLAELRAQGRRLGIVTAKRRATVDLAFARLPIADFFDVVVTEESTERRKPHPEPILLALDRLGAGPDEVAYVGDSPFDAEAARAAGVLAVGVTWGRMFARHQLGGADVVVDTPEELLGVL
jgi:pyrophosphatase PpaX